MIDEDDSPLAQIASSIERLEELLARLPQGLASDLKQKLGTLRTVLIEKRPPALALVGRRGSGKSSLVNAFFGAEVAKLGHVTAQTGRGKWFEYEGAGATMAILDTRGVQEGSPPKEADEARTPVESIVLELKKKAPDAILFLVKATEVDAAIGGDLDALEKVLSEIERAHGYRVPVFGVATHCDLLEPKVIPLHDAKGKPDADLEEKLRHVEQVERHLEVKLREREKVRSQVVAVVGVSTYQSWRADGTRRTDERWRIDALAKSLFLHLPNEGRAMFVRVARVQSLQDELAKSVTRATATLCAGMAAVPIPFADMIPITAMQVALIAAIAWIGGRTLDTRGAAEFLGGIGANVGAAFAFREVARALVKYVFPGGGSAVSGAVAFTGTMAIGAAARAYFVRGESLRKARGAFRRAREASPS